MTHLRASGSPWLTIYDLKCDETAPECRRCIKAGTKCPGFPKFDNFLSVNGSFNSGKQRKGENSKDALAVSSPQDADTAPASQVLDLSAVTIYRPMANWQDDASAFFMDNFVSPRKPVQGMFSFVPELLQQESKSTCLQLAFRATSLMSLASRSGMRSLQSKAYQSYGQALKSINYSLQNLNPKEFSSILGSILLMQFYEVSFLVTSLHTISPLLRY